jgi:hypothetical protein
VTVQLVPSWISYDIKAYPGGGGRHVGHALLVASLGHAAAAVDGTGGDGGGSVAPVPGKIVCVVMARFFYILFSWGGGGFMLKCCQFIRHFLFTNKSDLK